MNSVFVDRTCSSRGSISTLCRAKHRTDAARTLPLWQKYRADFSDRDFEAGFDDESVEYARYLLDRFFFFFFFFCLRCCCLFCFVSHSLSCTNTSRDFLTVADDRSTSVHTKRKHTCCLLSGTIQLGQWRVVSLVDHRKFFFFDCSSSLINRTHTKRL
jgi:hypothetical protein